MQTKTLTKEEYTTMQGMADCMDMVRQELIEAGIIDNTVAPMFIANVICGKFADIKHQQWCAEVNADGYREHLAEWMKDAAHWKSNHDDLVKRCALLREREDLPVDRIPAYNELVRLQAENNRLVGMVSFANDLIHDDPVLSKKLMDIANGKDSGA